ncbi:MAG TPA: sigma-70 family RNA polymerase sigma factor [Bryobacteraceae bacterium]|nr:sigma-70 family RNA polymerase sigma factor [Bryobacteraceae bacterium]
MPRGDQDALAALYDHTSPPVFGLLRRMLEHRADAEEALLDVYMKAWKNAPNYSPARGTVQPWLSMIARNIAIDRIRHRRAELTTFACDFGNEWDFAAEGISPERQSIVSERGNEIRKVLAELQPQYREVLLMAFFSGFTHSELAERLGQPLGTVKSRIRMALIKPREMIGDEPDGGMQPE